MTGARRESVEFDPADTASDTPDHAPDGLAHLANDPSAASPRPRRRFVLADDTGFDEVPAKYRRFYRRWRGQGDALEPERGPLPGLQGRDPLGARAAAGRPRVLHAVHVTARGRARGVGRLEAVVRY